MQQSPMYAGSLLLWHTLCHASPGGLHVDQ